MSHGRPKVPRIKVECAVCGKEVEKYLSQVQANKTGLFFCSQEHRQQHGTKPRTVAPKTCEWCGEEFVSYSKGRFCSKAHYDAWQGRNQVKLTCEGCQKEFVLRPSQAAHRTGRWCSRECEAGSRIKRALDRTHNGRPAVLDSAGYVRVYQPDHPAAYKGGWIAEHRLVAEQALGRHLASDEHVHHTNGDKADNRPENLVVLGHGEHSTITGVENGRRLREWEEYRRRFGPLE